MTVKADYNNGAVNLSWQDFGVGRYHVKKGKGTSLLGLKTIYEGQNTSLVDSDVKPGEIYFYQVTFSTGSFPSDYGSALVTIPNAAPAPLTPAQADDRSLLWLGLGLGLLFVFLFIILGLLAANRSREEEEK